MKIVTKIISFALLTLCLQVDAMSSGPTGFVSACSMGGIKSAASLRGTFKTTFGIDSSVCTAANIAAVQNIQAFVNDPTKFYLATETFATDVTAQEFVKQFSRFGNLLSNTSIFLTNYLDLAETTIETQTTTQAATITAQTTEETRQTAAIREIAKSLNPLSGAVTPDNLDEKAIKAIIASTKLINTNEEDARKFLNTLTLAWNKKEEEFISEPVSIFDPYLTPIFPEEVFQVSLKEYIQITFARRLQSISPVANPDFDDFIKFIQVDDEGKTDNELNVNLLNPKITLKPTDYSNTEAQAKAVINAMRVQIEATNNLLDDQDIKRAPVGPLSEKAKFVLDDMKKQISKTVVTKKPDSTPGSTKDTNVLKVIGQVEKLTKLTPCKMVQDATTSVQKLQLLPKAVTQMVVALNLLSVDVDKPAASGSNLADVIKKAIQKSATGPARGGTGAETNKNVKEIIEQVEKLTDQLDSCNAVKKAAEAKKLTLLPEAVTQMANALITFSNNPVDDITKLDGITFAKRITEYLEETSNQKLLEKITDDLISSNSSNLFKVLPTTFNLAELTADAPGSAANKTTDLGEVGNYLRQCAEAANVLKKLAVAAGMPNVMPANMQDLMTQSLASIRAKLKAAAAAKIPQVIIDSHNEFTQIRTTIFNALSLEKKKKNFIIIKKLNDAADAINAISPSSAKKIIFYVSKSDRTPLVINVDSDNITNTTFAVAVISDGTFAADTE